jgi:hypothetical protein
MTSIGSLDRLAANSTISALNSAVNARRVRGCFGSTFSMMNILFRDKPQILDVRQTCQAQFAGDEPGCARPLLGCTVGLMASEPDIETLRSYVLELLLATVVDTATGPKRLGACTADDVLYIAAELIASAGSPGDAGEFAHDSWRCARRVASGHVEQFVTSLAAGIVW